MERFGGKKVIVVGGTSGIGLATASQLMSEGAALIVTGTSSESVGRAKETLGKNAIVLQSDVTSTKDLQLLAEKAGAEFGSIDALIYCAGLNQILPFTDVTEEQYDEIFSTNARGAFFCVQKLAPSIAPGGAVVLTTSVANAKGLPNTSVYAATKAALRSLARTFGRELLAKQIRVNAVSPGPIDTGILDKSLSADGARQAKQQITDANPMKRFGTTEEVARALVFLAFDATFTTGAELVVDGGASQL